MEGVKDLLFIYLNIHYISQQAIEMQGLVNNSLKETM